MSAVPDLPGVHNAHPDSKMVPACAGTIEKFVLLVERIVHGVFRAADGVLHLAGGLVSRAFGLQFGVAGHFASGFLDGSCRRHGSPASSITDSTRSIEAVTI